MQTTPTATKTDGRRMCFSDKPAPAKQRVDASRIVYTLVHLTHISPPELSRRLGKAVSYIGALINKRSTPRLDTCAIIADECGCDVIIRERSTGRIVIINPKRCGALHYTAPRKKAS